VSGLVCVLFAIPFKKVCKDRAGIWICKPVQQKIFQTQFYFIGFSPMGTLFLASEILTKKIQQ